MQKLKGVIAVPESIFIDWILDDETIRQAGERLLMAVGGIKCTQEEADAILQEFRTRKDSIRKEMLNMTWKPGPAQAVIVPKKDGTTRTVMVLSRVDRLIQEAAFVVLKELMQTRLDDSVFFYEKYKGVRKAHKRCMAYLKAGNDWAIQIDVQNCSESLDRRIISRKLAKIMPSEDAIAVYEALMRLTTSDWFDERYEVAGIYASGELTTLLVDLCLMDLDHFLDRHELPFVRFGDDIMVFCKSGDEAHYRLRQIMNLLDTNLGLKPNPAKTAIQHGLYGPFLGGRFRWLPKKKRYISLPPQSRTKEEERPTVVAGNRVLMPESQGRRRKSIEKNRPEPVHEHRNDSARHSERRQKQNYAKAVSRDMQKERRRTRSEKKAQIKKTTRRLAENKFWE